MQGSRPGPSDRGPSPCNRSAGAETRGYQGSSGTGPPGQAAAKFQRWQGTTVVNAVGIVRRERADYYGRHCGHGHAPWETIRGRTSPDLTPGASELTSLAGVVAAVAEVSQKILPQLAGLRLCASTAQRPPAAAGQRLRAALASAATGGETRGGDWSREAAGRRGAYVSVDATGGGHQGPPGGKAAGKMVSGGLLVNAGDDGPSPARYRAGLYARAALGLQRRRQGGQVGRNDAAQWIALPDGGAGREQFRQRNVPLAECLLDFFQAAAHLNDLAQAGQPPDDRPAQELGRPGGQRLQHAGGPAVLAILAEVDVRGRAPVAWAVHRQVTPDVRNNVHRLDEPRSRANGWLLGSGPVAAACQTVVGQGLKGSGLRWSEAGAPNVSSLRARFKREAGQWDAFGAPAKAA